MQVSGEWKWANGALCSAGGTGWRLLGFTQWVIQLRGLRYLCWRGVDSLVTGGKRDRKQSRLFPYQRSHALNNDPEIQTCRCRAVRPKRVT